MKLLKSKKFTLPIVYFITDKEEIKELPIGVPFIVGNENVEDAIVRILEYEILYQEALKSGYPFNFRQILRDNGYTNLEDHYFPGTVYMDYVTTESIEAGEDFEDLGELKELSYLSEAFQKFIRDATAYVDIQKLKELNVFPIWLDIIEKAIHTNIHNFAVYNNNMYNKKLEGMYGSLDLVSPDKNLVIIDISGSIPRGVSATTLAMARNLAETFYCDLIITGSKSTLYPYEEIHKLNVEEVYEENGMDNDQVYFRKLLTKDFRHYRTVICFGDNHSPSYNWRNQYNVRTGTISREDGQALCQWTTDKLISFHTTSDVNTAGYADWFKFTEIEKISDWVKYL